MRTWPHAGPLEPMPPPSGILLVDDEDDVRIVLSALIRRLKPELELREAYDGIMALELLKDFPADLVVTDLSMPRMDGYELVSAIRCDPRLSSISILVMTSYSHQDTAIDVLDAGADDFMSKPVSPPEFSARVTALLRSRDRFRVRPPGTGDEQIPLSRLGPILRDLLGADKANDILSVLAHSVREWK